MMGGVRWLFGVGDGEEEWWLLPWWI